MNDTADRGLTLARLGADLVGLDLSRVLAVLEAPRVTPLPRIPGCCEGVALWQGQVIPVYDLKKVLNLPSAEDDNIRRDSVVIVGRWRSSAVGLRVDEVLGVFESGAPEPSGIGRPGIRGEAWLDGRRLLVLDPDADYPGSTCAQGASPRAT